MANFCGRCGAELTGKAQFCSACGFNIKEAEEGPKVKKVKGDTKPEDNELEELNEKAPESLTTYNMDAPKSEKDEDKEVYDDDIIFDTDEKSELQSMPEVKKEEDIREEVLGHKEEQEDHDEPEEYEEPVRPVRQRRYTPPPPKQSGKMGLFAKVFAVLFVILCLGAGLDFYKAYKDGVKDDIPKKIGNIDAYRVGSPDFGYVSLPTTWTQYTTQEGGATLQYSDGTGWITTLYSVSMQQLAPHTWSNSIVEEMKKMGAENVIIEPDKVYEYDGFHITGYYRNVNVYISAWIFDGKDSKTHYIAIEGPGLLTKDNSYYEIVNSFRLDK